METMKVFIEGVDLGQDTSQDPGGPNQQQEQPRGGCFQHHFQPGWARLWNPEGQMDRVSNWGPRQGQGIPGTQDWAETVS
jgi:hypothetical protein